MGRRVVESHAWAPRCVAFNRSVVDYLRADRSIEDRRRCRARSASTSMAWAGGIVLRG